MERYFLGSNTEKGFCGFYNETTDKIGSVYLLKGGAGTGKSSLIKNELNKLYSFKKILNVLSFRMKLCMIR